IENVFRIVAIGVRSVLLPIQISMAQVARPNIRSAKNDFANLAHAAETSVRSHNECLRTGHRRSNRLGSQRGSVGNAVKALAKRCLGCAVDVSNRSCARKVRTPSANHRVAERLAGEYRPSQMLERDGTN